MKVGLIRSLAIFTSSVFLASCTHDLEVKNIALYKPTFINSLTTPYKVGVQTTTTSPEEDRLIYVAAKSLKRDGFNVIYPFFPNDDNKNTIDYLVKISSNSAYKGSGANFWINWPGFLIWTPAWHGYHYKASYDISIGVLDSSKEKELSHIDIPIKLIIRHAASNRTWTEISWLEWSLIAFIGGFCFIKYDPSVTPILMDKHEDDLGDYIASKIADVIIGSTSNATEKKAVAPATLPT